MLLRSLHWAEHAWCAKSGRRFQPLRGVSNGPLSPSYQVQCSLLLLLYILSILN